MEWKVKRLFVEQTSEHPNVVVRVDWVCNGKPGFPKVFNSTYFDFPGNPFVEYKDLTEEEVLQWVWGKVDKGLIEQQVSTLPPPPPSDKELKPLPWG